MAGRRPLVKRRAVVKSPVRWVALAVALGLGLSVALGWDGWPAARWVGISRATGWLAALLLLLTLAASPLARSLEPGARMDRWRRAFGIGAAIAGLAHLAVGLAGPLRDAWAAVWTWPTYRAGLVATLVLSLLLVTSFPPVVRALRLRVWKPLHRLSYVAALLVALHLVRLPFAPVVGVVAFASAAGVLLLWRVAGAVLRRRSRGARTEPAATLSEGDLRG